jgi:hypothetical protein
MTKKQICEILKIDSGTLKNWETGRPEVYKIVMNHFENKTNNANLDNEDDLNNEIMNTLNKLPMKTKKKFYYLMMAELTELEE